MKDGPTMTPEQEAQWEEDLKAGRLFKTPAWRPPRVPRETKVEPVLSTLTERFPTRRVPRGGYAEVAAVVGVTRAYVQQLACREGFSVDNENARPMAVLKAIESIHASTGFPPTLEELAEAVELSGRGACLYVVTGLERRGLVVRGKRNQSRAIAVTDAGRALLEELKERNQ